MRKTDGKRGVRIQEVKITAWIYQRKGWRDYVINRIAQVKDRPDAKVNHRIWERSQSIGGLSESYWEKVTRIRDEWARTVNQESSSCKKTGSHQRKGYGIARWYREKTIRYLGLVIRTLKSLKLKTITIWWTKANRLYRFLTWEFNSLNWKPRAISSTSDQVSIKIASKNDKRFLVNSKINGIAREQTQIIQTHLYRTWKIKRQSWPKTFLTRTKDQGNIKYYYEETIRLTTVSIVYSKDRRINCGSEKATWINLSLKKKKSVKIMENRIPRCLSRLSSRLVYNSRISLLTYCELER